MKNFKAIKPGVLLVHMLITLAYPAFKAFTAESSPLLVFTDTLTIIALLLIILGVFYRLYLIGDFDATRFFIKRAVESDLKKDLPTYLADKKQEREAAFNYPLFLGIVYFAATLILAYGVL